MQLTVKDLTKIMVSAPDAIVSVAVVNGVQMKISPATQVQIMVNNIDGKQVKNLLIITNEETNVQA